MITFVKIREAFFSRIPCTATEIEQVFLNLIRNAAEFMAEVKEKEKKARLTLKTRKETDNALIELKATAREWTKTTANGSLNPSLQLNLQGWHRAWFFGILILLSSTTTTEP